MQTLFAVCENQKIRRSHRLEVRGRCAKPICLLPPTCLFSLKEIKGLRTLMEDYYLIMEEHVLFYIPPFCQAKYSC